MGTRPRIFNCSGPIRIPRSLISTKTQCLSTALGMNKAQRRNHTTPECNMLQDARREQKKRRSKEKRWKKRQGQSTKAAVPASNHGRVLLNSNIVMKTFVQILNGQQSYIVCHNPPAIHPTCSRAFPFSRLIGYHPCILLLPSLNLLFLLPPLFLFINIFIVANGRVV